MVDEMVDEKNERIIIFTMFLTIFSLSTIIHHHQSSFFRPVICGQLESLLIFYYAASHPFMEIQVEMMMVDEMRDEMVNVMVEEIYKLSSLSSSLSSTTISSTTIISSQIRRSSCQFKEDHSITLHQNGTISGFDDNDG